MSLEQIMVMMQAMLLGSVLLSISIALIILALYMFLRRQ